MHLTRQSQADKYLSRRQCMSQERILTQAFVADCRLPEKVSWHARLGKSTRLSCIYTFGHGPHLPDIPLQSVRNARTAQIQTDVSSRTSTSRNTKEGCRASARATICTSGAAWHNFGQDHLGSTLRLGGITKKVTRLDTSCI